MSDALAALAGHCGIADQYYDIWGRLHPTSAATRTALLAAMHLPEEQVARDPAGLLAALQAAEASRPLPPVLVARAGAPILIPHRLAGWQWTLRLESGATAAGACGPAGTLELPPLDELGYHRIEFRHDKERLEMPLIVVPARCHQPERLAAGGRVWGLAVQLYGLRSRRNWGIGDFGDLGTLLEFTHRHGGDLVGINPLHALFAANPAHISPYSPSQRGCVNPLYLDIEALPEFAACAAARRRVASVDFQDRLAALRASACVDYGGVAAAKSEILTLLFAHFQEAGGARAAAFAAWRAARGNALEAHARFEALHAHWRANDPACWGWPAWPAAYRDPASPAVAAFAAQHAAAVAYHAWLQWLADTQLGAVAARGRAAGLAVGIYQDLAIGANAGGAELWHWRETFAAGANTGAPPDEINSLGQDWGLPPFVPERLRAAAYAPLIDILRANMRHAGALRIDHVMGLLRLFWVPADMPASEGAYVGYPFEDLLGIVALESVRNRCLVIGEDLGTVPDGFRERLAEAGVLSYHPLIFERYPDAQFRLPADQPRQALVAVGTHDLPTLRGFWRGEDLRLRTELLLLPSEELRQRLVTERDWDRGRLLWALEREGLLPAGVSKDQHLMPELNDATVTAIHAYLARTPSQIMVIQPEDGLGVAEQANLPGTLEDQHPNWQRKLPVPIEDWPQQENFKQLLDAVRTARQ